MARQTREGRRISDELLDELLAEDDPAEVFRSGSLIDDLKKAVAERALDAHLEHEPASGNHRNGHNRKRALTDEGAMELEVSIGLTCVISSGSNGNGRAPRAPVCGVPDFAPILLEESAVADQVRAGDVGVGVGHGSSVKKKRTFQVIQHATRNGTPFLFPECKIESRKYGSIDNT